MYGGPEQHRQKKLSATTVDEEDDMDKPANDKKNQGCVNCMYVYACMCMYACMYVCSDNLSV